MSLINDALKRAAQKPAAAPITVDLRPAEEAGANGFPVVTLFIVLIPLIALGLWFLAKGLQLKETPVRAETAIAPEPVQAPVVVVVTNPPPTVTAPPPVPQPLFKLQGIYWRPSKPSAVVNGKTVYVGDRVENARVKAIDQESVTLTTAEGEAKTLLLP